MKTEIVNENNNKPFGELCARTLISAFMTTLL